MSDSIFNEVEYLAANPDVAAAVKEGKICSGREHYEKYGKSEGRKLRQLVGAVLREDKVFHLLDKKGLGLEIGPSYNPIAPKKGGFNVQTLDLASAAELRKKFLGCSVNLDNIEEVDFVWHGEPLHELIGKTSCYDWIIASHVIEHVPDMISFLRQCEALLKPDGILSLVIPDKRCCFDYFSSISSTGNMLDAYTEKRVRPSHGQVFDHVANASKRNGKSSWSADERVVEEELMYTFDQAQGNLNSSISSSNYIDVHCWRFTPASFRLLISDLKGLGLIGFEIKAEFDTTGCEFFVLLDRQGDTPVKSDRFSMLKTRKLEGV